MTAIHFIRQFLFVSRPFSMTITNYHWRNLRNRRQKSCSHLTISNELEKRLASNPPYRTELITDVSNTLQLAMLT